jgi:LPPG:FO 2-phospho-L-lactate transferase
MMSERGIEPSALGVVRHYGGMVDGWVIDEADRALAPAIAALGYQVKVCNTIMQTLDDKRRLAQDTLQLASEMAG